MDRHLLRLPLPARLGDEAVDPVVAPGKPNLEVAIGRRATLHNCAI